MKKLTKLQRILSAVEEYAFLAAGWEPRKEDDWADFKAEIRKILGEKDDR